MLKNYDLSIIIPARNEEFLPQTVADIVKNKRGKTEVIVVLDGYWPDPGVEDHPDVRVIALPESIGQRGAQNIGVKLSQAKYVAKADAHTAYDEGFDVKLVNAMQDDITLVPVMRNLHVFDWVCDNCGMRTYQGPKPEECRNEICDSAKDGGDPNKTGHLKDVVWIPKTNPQSSAYRFNKNLQFKYFPELRKIQGETGLQETMSLQGSFFMCTRENYWKKKLCDESWGSWGQQGTEVALKTWLSGGRVMCLRDTWYAHLFRTQRGFSFPYPMDGNSQERARKISREIFMGNKWDQQVHPLEWLLEKFWPQLDKVQDQEARWERSDWEKGIKPAQPSRGILYYTACNKPLKIARKVQNQLRSIAEDKGLSITSTSVKPMDKMGRNIWLPLEYTKTSYFHHIITCLRFSKADIVYFCEDDVLYHPSHFDYVPTDDKFHFNQNWWRIREDGMTATWDANQVSGLVCRREVALEWYRNKLQEIEKKGFDRSYEPGNSENQVAWQSEVPNVDIRTGKTVTGEKWSLDDFRDKSTAKNFQTSNSIPGWENLDLF